MIRGRNMHCLKKIEISLRYMVIALWLLICFSGWLICSAYAKYVTSASESDGARVAKFSVIQEGPATQQIMVEHVYPGFCEAYPVIVTNNSEVTIVYNITAVNRSDQLPLMFRMLDENNKEIVSNGAMIAGGDDSEHVYKLEISWPADQADPIYAGKTDMIDIRLEAVQKE